jgi:hypothetical protein
MTGSLPQVDETSAPTSEVVEVPTVHGSAEAGNPPPSVVGFFMFGNGLNQCLSC